MSKSQEKSAEAKWEPIDQTVMHDPALTSQMDSTSMIDEQTGLVREAYKSEERVSQARLIPALQSSPSNRNINFQGKSPVSQHVHVPLGIPLNTTRRIGNSNNKMQASRTNLNAPMSTL